MTHFVTLYLCIFFAALSFTAIAAADDEAMLKYRNHTPEQIGKLLEKTRRSEVPMAYNMAAETGLSHGSELVFAMQLNTLMYAGLHDYQAAIKAYQTDLGDKPSGVLTVSQIHTLQKRFEMQKLSQVHFPDDYRSSFGDNYASIQGTITILGEKIAWPINHVKISCYKSQGYCELNQMSLSIPDEDSWVYMYSVSEHPTELFEITRWTRDSIEAQPYEGDTGCRINTLSLNFKNKEFFYITRNGEDGCETLLGGTLERLAKPRISQIVDGKKIIEGKFNEMDRAAFSVLSKEFQKKVEKLTAVVGGAEGSDVNKGQKP